MTTKLLTGTYSAGYSVLPSVTLLEPTSSAYIGGVGIVASATVRVENLGRVQAAAGAAGGPGHYQGRLGSAGVDLAAGGAVINFSTIAGGAGGAGGFNSSNGEAYAGGAGAQGIVLAAGGVTNHGNVTGGAGGGGGNGRDGSGGVGGGDAGCGIELISAGAVMNGGSITGGAGGAGGYGYLVGGGGGNGGAAVLLIAGGALTNNGSAIVGGQGGMGGGGHYNVGVGGVGGTGVAARGSSSIHNNQAIRGGQGGDGAYGLSRQGGAGGYGGIGMALDGGTISNAGTIAGGKGGTGGGSSLGAIFSNGGAGGGRGGYGVSSGPGIDLTNDGSIEGGAGGAGGFLGSGMSSGNALAGGAGGNGGAGLLAGGGSILNRGTIAGGAGGAGGAAPPGYVVGQVGARGVGVILFAGAGNITNGGGTARAALIEGQIGVYIDGSGASTVINFGTIDGDVNSVKFLDPGSLLVAESGAQFIGEIAGGGGTFELLGGASTVTGLGGAGVVSGADSARFGGFASYIMEGDVTLAGTNALASGQTLTDRRALVVTGALNEAAGATISVAADATMAFKGTGGVLAGTIGGLGKIGFVGDTDTLNGTHLTAAHFNIQAARLTLEGSITNSGTASLEGSHTTLVIGAGGATLSGGTWSLGVDSFGNVVVGQDPSDTLNNASATITGAGLLGEGKMVLINRSAGVIDGNNPGILFIDTGSNQIANAGLIEATGKGTVLIGSAVLNAGTLKADGGALIFREDVRGPGSAVIAAGAVYFDQAFSGNVTFSGTGGLLYLGMSQGYAGAITGFSTSGGTSLDLRDIGFVSAGEATFSGTATSGVLTVTDGIHTAHITLIGDYLSSTFVAKSDGFGGVTITDPTAPSAAAAHRFIAAAAGLGGSAGEAIHVGAALASQARMLASPHTMVA